MKRGLKDQAILQGAFLVEGCKDYPDEKGTERRRLLSAPLRRWKDARITPMKRGLKGRIPSRKPGRPEDARITPMKRGLKGRDSGRNFVTAIDARITPMKRGLKGTESGQGYCVMIAMQGLPR